MFIEARRRNPSKLEVFYWDIITEIPALMEFIGAALTNPSLDDTQYIAETGLYINSHSPRATMGTFIIKDESGQMSVLTHKEFNEQFTMDIEQEIPTFKMNHITVEDIGNQLKRDELYHKWVSSLANTKRIETGFFPSTEGKVLKPFYSPYSDKELAAIFGENK